MIKQLDLVLKLQKIFDIFESLVLGSGSVKGERGIQACECYTQENGPFAHFGYLSRNVLTFFKTGKCPYPVERTLLSGGMVEAGCQSLARGHRVETPHMRGVAYTVPPASLFGGHEELAFGGNEH